MRHTILFIALLALSIGCTTNQISPESTSATNFNCIKTSEAEIRVFHSMYKNKESAEAVYLAITTNASSHQLSQLKSAANKESIDDGTRGSDGDLGYIRDWQYDPGFVKSVFSLPLKTLSHPVQSSFGWHLVWVDDKRDFLTGERSQC